MRPFSEVAPLTTSTIKDRVKSIAVDVQESLSPLDETSLDKVVGVSDMKYRGVPAYILGAVVVLALGVGVHLCYLVCLEHQSKKKLRGVFVCMDRVRALFCIFNLFPTYTHLFL